MPIPLFQLEHPIFQVMKELRDNFTRFTLFRKKEPEEPPRDQNLERKYTKGGVEDFCEKVENDPDVRLEDLDNYHVQVQQVEQTETSLREVLSRGRA